MSTRDSLTNVTYLVVGETNRAIASYCVAVRVNKRGPKMSHIQTVVGTVVVKTQFWHRTWLRFGRDRQHW